MKIIEETIGYKSDAPTALRVSWSVCESGEGKCAERVSIEIESSDSFREPSRFRKVREDSGRKTAISRQTLAQAAKLDKVKKFKESLMRLGVLECAIEEDEDDSIRNAINKFQVEVLMNFLIKYRESGAALPSIRFDDPPSAGEVRFAGAPSESCGALVH